MPDKDRERSCIHVLIFSVLLFCAFSFACFLASGSMFCTSKPPSNRAAQRNPHPVVDVLVSCSSLSMDSVLGRSLAVLRSLFGQRCLGSGVAVHKQSFQKIKFLFHFLCFLFALALACERCTPFHSHNLHRHVREMFNF